MKASNNSNVGENWGVIVNFYVPCVKPKESFIRIKKLRRKMSYSLSFSIKVHDTNPI